MLTLRTAENVDENPNQDKAAIMNDGVRIVHRSFLTVANDNNITIFMITHVSITTMYLKWKDDISWVQQKVNCY